MADDIDRAQFEANSQSRPAETATDSWISLRGTIAALVAVVLLVAYSHLKIVHACLLVGFGVVPTRRWINLIAGLVTIALLTLTGLPIVQSCLVVGFCAVVKLYWEQRGKPWERLWPWTS